LHVDPPARRARQNQRASVVIGSDAFVGANAVVMPGVVIGAGAVAGAELAGDHRPPAL
jgi:acetyltransferase-like isoleucine patch superfamily enzyme